MLERDGIKAPGRQTGRPMIIICYSGRKHWYIQLTSGRRDRKVDTAEGNGAPVASDAAFAGAVILDFHPILIERSENREPTWNGQHSGNYGRSFRFVAPANPCTT
ncbi:uncharacterized protein GLRG_03434 [Colletotrichum graminicola M1.001]|uniref:Uncharacterized protein n=1 Tax=Colletotrichum graminicola (strain M1.001 / M2 / FGSC 10212) TaxID=645133 RepID=E3QBF1_COLGM|nr:uncharacterized protein GLRG_03434 [Colletotrichum graminicola M1.001]EFQ28290.1 hypothetical protein GLRG_03434 [Colletotrichum graminicola M1.001]